MEDMEEKDLQVGEIVTIDGEKYYCDFGEGCRACAVCDFGHKHKVWYDGCPIGEFGYDCCAGSVYLMSSSLKIRLIDSEIKQLQELKEKLQ
jgi:hypothetical protein